MLSYASIYALTLLLLIIESYGQYAFHCVGGGACKPLYPQPPSPQYGVPDK